MREIELHPISAPDAWVTPPGSKSFTNRALACAALAEGNSRLLGWLDSDDTRAMIEALRHLGVGIDIDDGTGELRVEGRGGRFAVPPRPVDCRASGTTLRFLTALAALAPGTVVLDGTERMRERPIQELADALRDLNVPVSTAEGCPPVRVEGGRLDGGEVSLDASRSSQFLSTLLLVAPLAPRDVHLRVRGITSRPYVDMTLATLSDFGIQVEAGGGNDFEIRHGQTYRPRRYAVEPDATAATYFMAAAAVTGGRVRIRGLSPASTQPDVRFAEVLARMGCSVRSGPDWISVGGPRVLRGVEVDLNDLPDSAQTLAVVALFAEGPTSIRNVANLRLKETDRMAAIEAELEKLGAAVALSDRDIHIDPPPEPRPARIATYDDHRMAMSFAVAGLAADGIVIQDPDCVSKTFPDFFERLTSLGS